MYMLKQKFAVFLGFLAAILISFSLSVAPVFAQFDTAPNNGDPGAAQTCKDGTLDNALCSPRCKNSNDCNLTKTYINPIINKFLAPLAILSVIIGIIWGSIEFATSAGDAQRAASGKGKIQKALIGLIAFIFLFAFLQWLLPGGLI
jgi:hypothetical protein